MALLINIYQYISQLYLQIGQIFNDNAEYLFPLIIGLFTLTAIISVIIRIIA